MAHAAAAARSWAALSVFIPGVFLGERERAGGGGKPEEKAFWSIRGGMRSGTWVQVAGREPRHKSYPELFPKSLPKGDSADCLQTPERLVPPCR